MLVVEWFLLELRKCWLLGSFCGSEDICSGPTIRLALRDVCST